GAVLFEQSKGAELIVPARGHALSGFAAKNASNVGGPKSFLDAGDAREDLLRENNSIRDRLQVPQANIAGPARTCMLLTEVLHQHAVAAKGTSAIAIHVFEMPNRVGQKLRV